jgi:signal transduction histidine kinase
MSLRRADPARGSRRYDRWMPVTQGDGRPHWDGRWDGRPDHFRPPPAVTLLAPVIISLLVQVPAAIGIAVWLRVGWAAGLAQVALAAIGPLALLASRRYPGPTVAVVSAAALADLLLTPDVGPPYVALAFAIVLGIARGAMLWTVLSVVVGWVAAIVLGAVVGLDWHPFRIALTTALLAACFGIGAFVRVRRERAAEFRAEAMRRRQTAEQRERVRIARELHDVIGHALSQINVQASVGLHLMDRDPEQARSALAAVKETSRTALEEVRSVLGVIRNEGDAPLAPQAELAELPRLVAGVRSPGFDAELVDRLDGAVPGRAAQFAAFRIAQEALTNVVRHAGATTAVVAVERLGDELLVTVDDDGAGVRGSPEGSGILGMRERAALLGGSVEVGASPRGGTRVTTRLPWGATP